jgi:hypothetical protein
MKFLILLTISLVSCTGYQIESDGVYYKDWNEARGSGKRLLEDADPETFVVLENDNYGKDEKLVFYQGKKVTGADAPSFVPLDDIYAKDRLRGYYSGDSIEFSDGTTFKIIDSYYSEDKNDIFYTTRALHVCSTSDFEIFDNDIIENKYERWSTDKCFYYFKNFKIPSKQYNDVKIFKGSAGFAKDKQWVYYLDRKINYNQDGKKILDTVDVETFTVTDYIRSRDKFGCINVFHGRKKCN